MKAAKSTQKKRKLRLLKDKPAKKVKKSTQKVKKSTQKKPKLMKKKANGDANTKSGAAVKRIVKSQNKMGATKSNSSTIDPDNKTTSSMNHTQKVNCRKRKAEGNGGKVQVKTMKMDRKETADESSQEKVDLDKLKIQPFTDLVYTISGFPCHFSLIPLKRMFDNVNLAVEFIKAPPNVYCIIDPEHRDKLELLDGRLFGKANLKFYPRTAVRPSSQLAVPNLNKSTVSRDDLKKATRCENVELIKSEDLAFIELDKTIDAEKLGKRITLNGQTVQVVRSRAGISFQRAMYNESCKRGKRLIVLLIPDVKRVTYHEIEEVTGGQVIKVVPSECHAILEFRDVAFARKLARALTLNVKGQEIEVNWIRGPDASKQEQIVEPIKVMEPVKVKKPVKRVRVKKRELDELPNDLVYKLHGVPFHTSLARLKRIFDTMDVKVEFMKVPPHVYCIVNEKRRRQFESLGGRSVGEITLQFDRCTEARPLYTSYVSVSPFNPSIVSKAALVRATGCETVDMMRVTDKAYVEVGSIDDVDRLGDEFLLNGRFAQVCRVTSGSLYVKSSKKDKHVVLLDIPVWSGAKIPDVEKATRGRVLQFKPNVCRAFLKFKDRELARKIARDTTMKVNGENLHLNLLGEFPACSETGIRSLNSAEFKTKVESDATADLVYEMTGIVAFQYPIVKLKHIFNEMTVPVEFMKAFNKVFCIVNSKHRDKLLSLNGHSVGSTTLKFDLCEYLKPSSTLQVSCSMKQMSVENIKEAMGCDKIQVVKYDGKAFLEFESQVDADKLGDQIVYDGQVVQVCAVNRGVLYEKSVKKGKKLVVLTMPHTLQVNHQQLTKLTGGRIVKLTSSQYRAYLEFKNRDSARKVAQDTNFNANGVKLHAIVCGELTDVAKLLERCTSSRQHLTYEMSGVPLDFPLTKLKQIFDGKNVLVEFMKYHSKVFCVIDPEQREKLNSLGEIQLGDATVKLTPANNCRPSRTLRVSDFNTTLVSEEQLREATGCAKVNIVEANDSKVYVELDTQADVDELGKILTLNGRNVEVRQLEDTDLRGKLCGKDKQCVELCIPDVNEVTHHDIEEATGGRIITTLSPLSNAYLEFKDVESARKVARDVTLNVEGEQLEMTLVSELETNRSQKAKSETSASVDSSGNLVYKMIGVPAGYSLTKLKQIFDASDIPVEFMKHNFNKYCVVNADHGVRLESLNGLLLGKLPLLLELSDLKMLCTLSVSPLDPSLVSQEDLRQATDCENVEIMKSTE